jgi:hypothetical protein
MCCAESAVRQRMLGPGCRARFAAELDLCFTRSLEPAATRHRRARAYCCVGREAWLRARLSFFSLCWKKTHVSPAGLSLRSENMGHDAVSGRAVFWRPVKPFFGFSRCCAGLQHQTPQVWPRLARLSSVRQRPRDCAQVQPEHLPPVLSRECQRHWLQEVPLIDNERVTWL